MYDIITVGSGTEDVFVKTKNPEIITKNNVHEVCYPIGTKIIVDDIYFSTGGGGTNTATSFSRLGLNTAYLGKVGDDKTGRRLLSDLKDENVEFIGKKDKKGKTGYSVILIGLEKDRTILNFKGVANELRKNEINLKNMKTKWFYFSSLMGESFETMKRIASFAKKNNIKYAFNPSSYCTKKGLKYIKNIAEGCDILIMNKEEASQLVGKSSINLMLKKLQQHCKIAIITDGKKGAYAYNGIEKYTVNPRKIKVIETTGAGDSFGAGVTAGAIKNKSLEDCLKLGQLNAESVLGDIGAKNNLITKTVAEKLLKTNRIKVKKEAI